jgi:hypothetical protein
MLYGGEVTMGCEVEELELEYMDLEMYNFIF